MLISLTHLFWQSNLKYCLFATILYIFYSDIVLTLTNITLKFFRHLCLAVFSIRFFFLRFSMINSSLISYLRFRYFQVFDLLYILFFCCCLHYYFHQVIYNQILNRINFNQSYQKNSQTVYIETKNEQKRKVYIAVLLLVLTY